MNPRIGDAEPVLVGLGGVGDAGPAPVFVDEEAEEGPPLPPPRDIQSDFIDMDLRAWACVARASRPSSVTRACSLRVGRERKSEKRWTRRVGKW